MMIDHSKDEDDGGCGSGGGGDDAIGYNDYDCHG